MLPLDSPRWSELQQAYGSAVGVPEMIETLEAGDEVDEEMWSSLCHQGAVHAASYAAVPHVVRIAARRDPQKRLTHLVFIAAIAQGAREGRSAIPADLRDDYVAALASARTMALESFDAAEWSETEAMHLLYAIAMLSDAPTVGAALDDLANGEIALSCSACDGVFYLRPTESGLHAAKDL